MIFKKKKPVKLPLLRSNHFKMAFGGTIKILLAFLFLFILSSSVSSISSVNLVHGWLYNNCTTADVGYTNSPLTKVGTVTNQSIVQSSGCNLGNGAGYFHNSSIIGSNLWRTIEYWVIPNTQQASYPFSMMTSTWGVNQINIQHSKASPILFEYSHVNSSAIINSVNVFNLTNGTLSHVVLTTNGTHWNRYVNGALKYSAATAVNFPVVTIFAIGARGDSLAEVYNGTVSRFSVFNVSFNSSDVTDSYNAGVGRDWLTYDSGSTPTPPTPVFVSPTPVNNAKNNTQVTINVSCNVTGVNIYLWFNSTNPPLTLVLSNSTTGTYTTNVSVEQKYYYIAACRNATSGVFSVNSSLMNWTYDVTRPSITLNALNGFNTNNASTENQFDNNLTINFSLADATLLYAYELNITKGGVVYYNETNTSGYGGNNFTFNKTFNTASWPVGVYNVQISSSDSHTAKDIPDYSFTKNMNGLSFNVHKGNKIEVSSEDQSVVNTKKLKDRYDFEFNFTDQKEQKRVFHLTSNKYPLVYLPSSSYEGHFVSYGDKGGNWIDFEGVSSDLNVEKVSDFHYIITFVKLKKDVKFNSIGGLNTNEVNYTWYRGNYSYTNVSGLTGETVSVSLNVSRNSSTISNISAVIYYNGTLKNLTTYTLSSDNAYFVYSYTAPNIANVYNFTWVVTVNQSLGLNYNFNVSSGQIVTTFSVDNCTLSANKTLTFNVFNESSLTDLNASWEMDISYWATSKNNANNFTMVRSNLHSVSLCISPITKTLYADIYFQFTVFGGFTHRWYLFNQTLNGTENNISIYNFDSSAGVSDMRITARDINMYNYFLNTVASLQRFYAGENVWRTVQMDKSGDYGLIFFNIIEESIDYRFVFKDVNNSLLKMTDSMKFSCTSGICDLTVLLSPYDLIASSNKIGGNLTYSNNTGNVTFIWIHPTGESVTVAFSVDKVLGSGNVNVCNSSMTGTGGTFMCSVAAFTGSVLVTVYQQGSAVYSEFIDVGGQKLGNLLNDRDKAFWAFGIVLVVMVFGLFSPVGGVIATFLGVLFVFLLGIIPEITIPFMIVLAGVAVIIGLKLKT